MLKCSALITSKSSKFIHFSIQHSAFRLHNRQARFGIRQDRRLRPRERVRRLPAVTRTIGPSTSPMNPNAETPPSSPGTPPGRWPTSVRSGGAAAGRCRPCRCRSTPTIDEDHAARRLRPTKSSQSAAGTHTSADPTTGTSEQNAVATPQMTGAVETEQPERHAADQALRGGDQQPGADAGDDEVPRLRHQALAFALGERQQVADLPAERVAVAQQEEQTRTASRRGCRAWPARRRPRRRPRARETPASAGHPRGGAPSDPPAARTGPGRAPSARAARSVPGPKARPAARSR